MFFQSKLFKFLLPLLSYLFFSFIWLYNYMVVWYGNIPEETEYFRKPQMGNYAMIGYLFAASFTLFLILGIIYLANTFVSRIVIYLLIANLIISTFFVFLYAVTFNNVRTNSSLLFLNLFLFGLSISRLTRHEELKPQKP